MSVLALFDACTRYLPAALWLAFMTCRPVLVAVTPVSSAVKLIPSFCQVTPGRGTPVTVMFSANVSFSLCVISKPFGVISGSTICDKMYR